MMELIRAINAFNLTELATASVNLSDSKDRGVDFTLTRTLNEQLQEFRRCAQAIDLEQPFFLSQECAEKIPYLQQLMPNQHINWSRLEKLPVITPHEVSIAKVTIKDGNGNVEKDVLLATTRAPRITGLVFSGGGSKGLVYPGVSKALEEKGMMADIERVAGSSAGAMTALLVSIGYDAKELEQIVLNTNMGSLVQTSLVGGRDDGKRVVEYIADLERRKIREYLGRSLLTDEEFAEKMRGTLDQRAAEVEYIARRDIAKKRLGDHNYTLTYHDLEDILELLQPEYAEKIRPEIERIKELSEKGIPAEISPEIKEDLQIYFEVIRNKKRQILTREEYLAEHPEGGEQYNAILSSLENFSNNKAPEAIFSFQDAANLRSILKPEYRHKIKSLYMTGTRMDTKEIVEFCVENTPHLSRALAAQASGAHPLAFYPVWIESLGCWVNDGGISDNVPVRMLEKYGEPLFLGEEFSPNNLIFVLEQIREGEESRYQHKVLATGSPSTPSFMKATQGVLGTVVTGGVNHVAKQVDSQQAIQERSHRVIVLNVGAISTLEGLINDGRGLPQKIEAGIKNSADSVNNFLKLREDEGVYARYSELKDLLSRCATKQLWAVFYSEAISESERESVLKLIQLRYALIATLQAKDPNKNELENRMKNLEEFFVNKQDLRVTQQNIVRAYSILNKETKGRCFEILGPRHRVVSSVQEQMESFRKLYELLDQVKKARNEVRASYSSSNESDLITVIDYLETMRSNFQKGEFVQPSGSKHPVAAALKNLKKSVYFEDVFTNVSKFLNEFPAEHVFGNVNSSFSKEQEKEPMVSSEGSAKEIQEKIVSVEGRKDIHASIVSQMAHRKFEDAASTVALAIQHLDLIKDLGDKQVYSVTLLKLRDAIEEMRYKVGAEPDKQRELLNAIVKIQEQIKALNGKSNIEEPFREEFSRIHLEIEKALGLCRHIGDQTVRASYEIELNKLATELTSKADPLSKITSAISEIKIFLANYEHVEKSTLEECISNSIKMDNAFIFSEEMTAEEGKGNIQQILLAARSDLNELIRREIIRRTTEVRHFTEGRKGCGNIRYADLMMQEARNLFPLIKNDAYSTECMQLLNQLMQALAKKKPESKPQTLRSVFDLGMFSRKNSTRDGDSTRTTQSLGPNKNQMHKNS